MKKINLYKADATVEELNRNGHLLTAVSAKVYEELLTSDQAGAFNAVVRIPVCDKHASDFKAGAILKMSTPENEEELFRIKKTTKTLTDITANAWQISYDLRNYLIGDRAWVAQPLMEVWPDILQAGGANRFIGSSDIGTVAGARVVRRSVLDAIVGDTVSVKDRWGGELERRGFEVNMLNRRGRDRGFQIRYGKNLIGINDEVDTTEAYHAVLPTYLTGHNVATVMDVIKSPLYDFTTEPRTIPIHYGDIRVGEGEDDYATAEVAEAEVQARVASMWDQGADRPRASATINFAALRGSWDLHSVYLGDTVRAIWEDQIDIPQRVISYEWDALLDEYVNINLGSPRKGVEAFASQIQTIISSEVKDQASAVGGMVDSALALNNIYANSLGFFPTLIKNEETGARTLYIHDQPALDDSQFIAAIPEAGTYMWTRTGWNDGDPVWTEGVTQEGNLLMRYIQAEGIDVEEIFIGNKRSQTGIRISYDGRISFLDHGSEVAYISDRLMQILSAIFVDSAVISGYLFRKIDGTDIFAITYVGE